MRCWFRPWPGPDFVSLREVDNDRLSELVAVHTLELEVSGAVRPGEYIGELIVVTDHPTNREVRMPLRFVVTASERVLQPGATVGLSNRAAETAGQASSATPIRSESNELP